MKLLHLPYAATSHRMRSCRIPSSPCGNHDRQPPTAVDEQQQTKTTPPPVSHHYMYTQPAAAKGGVPVPLTYSSFDPAKWYLCIDRPAWPKRFNCRLSASPITVITPGLHR
jgi:hypothetical protein